MYRQSYTCETYKPRSHGQYPYILKCKHNSKIICHFKFTCTCTISDLIPFRLLHLKIIGITEIPHNSSNTAAAATVPRATPTTLVPSAINNKCK